MAKAASSTALSWRDVTPAPIVLLSGPEEYFAQRARDLLRKQLRAAHPDLEVTSFDAGEYAPGSLALASSPSLFGEYKLLEVSRLEAMNDAFLTDALALAGSGAEDTVILLRHAGGTRGKKLLDTVKAAWPVVDCQPLKKDTDKNAFVSAEFRAGGRRIEGPAVLALVQAVGSQTAELAAACQQLMEDTSGAVTAETVEQYYGGRVEASAFKVADKALDGDAAGALATLRHALATGADPVPLVAALAAKLRTLARVAGSRGSAAQLARDLGMQPWLVEQAQRDIRRWTPERLRICIRAVAEADAQVKGLSRDPVYAVERIVHLVATSVSAR
ncbi:MULTISPECIES: DNA polymerase III subunit delta [Arthrobacter]|uniref:DNA-directed DNA polymerase n=2 Tax=Arthrobacter TaxID=1663 RepID=A0ABU9KGL1_9MICC|nr:DNA polymerase III subunit delta [Arthrobacter sp. YJM1]MDP5226025.1 DNA polymerase III subunit delta [Arthrobacter sp. YJM1]